MSSILPTHPPPLFTFTTLLLPGMERLATVQDEEKLAELEALKEYLVAGEGGGPGRGRKALRG